MVQNQKMNNISKFKNSANKADNIKANNSKHQILGMPMVNDIEVRMIIIKSLSDYNCGQFMYTSRKQDKI